MPANRRFITALTVLILLPVLSQAFSPDKRSNTVRFLPNEGQWDEAVRYKANIPGGQLFIGEHTLTYRFWDQEQLSRYHHKKDSAGVLKGHILKMKLENAAETVSIRAKAPSETRFNFFKGDNPDQWATGLRSYQRLRLRDVYPGVDMVLKGRPDGIKYNFVVEADADPSRIQMQWKGADSLKVVQEQLKATTSLQPLIEDQPVAYTLGTVDGKSKRKQEVPCHFDLTGNQVQFQLPDKVSTNQRLLIDPEVIFATYSGSRADNFGFTGTFDSAGHAYSGGTVYNAGFPTTTGAVQDTFAGGKRVDRLIGDIERDVGILKYTEDGSSLIYATYLGGGHNEQPHSMIVNSKQELLVFGTTFSSDSTASSDSTGFPVTAGAYQTENKGQSDAYIAKLAPDGRTLINSTLLGGKGRDGLNGKYRGGNRQYQNRTILGYNYGDLYRGEIMVDSQDQVYIASTTQSPTFPTSPGAFQENFGDGYQDGFVTKFGDSLQQLEWSTFIGGRLEDAAYSVKVNEKQEVYVTGGTKSRDFPGLGNGWQSTLAGGVDGYVLKLSANGQKAEAGTYLGSPAFDQSYFVEIGGDGGIYVTGQSEGRMPVKNANYEDPNSGQFISKFSPDLKALQLSTTFGSSDGTPDIAPSAFLVDICGNIYVSGWGGETNGRGSQSKADFLQNMPLTNNAYQTRTDGSDFYLAVFRKGMDSLLYGSYLGGAVSQEHVDGGTSRFDKKGVVYQSICGGCGGNSDFPTTEGAHSRDNNSNNCNNAFLKLELDVANQGPEVNEGPDSEVREFFELQPFDTLRYEVPVKDPNKDSVFISGKGELFSPKEARISPARLTQTKGKAPYNTQLTWAAGCPQVGDTFKVQIKGIDNGCPATKNDLATIEVYVDSLPDPNTPPVFCSRVIDSNTFRVSWDSLKGEPAVSHYELMRINPNGDTLKLDSLNPRITQAYEDETAFGVRERAYCYYLRTVNLCGRQINSSYKICTGPDYQMKPKTIDIREVTVVNDQNLRITWTKSTDNEFAEYQLLRKPNDAPDQDFQLYATFGNPDKTTFVDSSTEVSETSYCYKVRVRDLCGFYGVEGYQGCSIVLGGDSEPFEHMLDWNPYKKWPGGISHYRIFRRDPLVDTTFQPIARISGDEALYTDDELNYEVGAYWYKVKAYEQPAAGQRSKRSVSQSNIIYLEQKPILHVPSAFTINRDGLNEHWGLEPVFVKDIHVNVYNRWGAKVYETRDLDDKWYGPPAGSSYTDKMSDNVYLYQIYYKGWDEILRSKTGDVTILK